MDPRDRSALSETRNLRNRENGRYSPRRTRLRTDTLIFVRRGVRPATMRRLSSSLQRGWIRSEGVIRRIGNPVTRVRGGTVVCQSFCPCGTTWTLCGYSAIAAPVSQARSVKGAARPLSPEYGSVNLHPYLRRSSRARISGMERDANFYKSSSYESVKDT